MCGQAGEGSEDFDKDGEWVISFSLGASTQQ
jgi:hypothetical protein